MPDRQIVAQIRRKFRLQSPSLNERTRRHWSATEALALGTGGISTVAAATGMSRATIRAGIAELQSPRQQSLPAGRIRHQGGGRPRAISRDPELLQDLKRLIGDSSRRKSREPLLWSLDSARALARKLAKLEHRVSYRTVATLLREMGYRLRGKRPRGKNIDSPDLAVQFKTLNERVGEFLKHRQPVIFVELKTKRAESRMGLRDSLGWSSARIGEDTEGFVLKAISRWWKKEKSRFCRVKKILVVVVGGGNGGAAELHLTAGLKELGQKMGVSTELCRLPRGTSKWCNIEQRVLSLTVHQKRRSGPLVGRQVVVEVIGRPKKRTR